MKVYTARGKRVCLRLTIPDDWHRSLYHDVLAAPELPRLSGEQPSYSITFVGPESDFLHILATPLSEHEPVPTVSETEEYFDGLSHRENLMVIDTGTIEVGKQKHFWATYYRMQILMAPSPWIQFYKKYCLELSRIEYLLTAVLGTAQAGQPLPTDEELGRKERLYDQVIVSFVPLDGNITTTP